MSPQGHGLLVRYWAGARAAAGTTEEYVTLPSNARHSGESVAAGAAADVVAADVVVADVVTAIESRHPDLAPILEVASLLLDGRAASRDEPVGSAETLEVLPPFAGG